MINELFIFEAVPRAPAAHPVTHEKYFLNFGVGIGISIGVGF